MKNFEELSVFQRAVDLMEEVYRSTEPFPAHERYGLVSQLRRASISVMSHIAEGQGRLSLGEWRQFLSQARGSLYEVQAQAIASERLRYLVGDDYARVRTAVKRVAGPLRGLIRYVQEREKLSRAKRQPDNPRT